MREIESSYKKIRKCYFLSTLVNNCKSITKSMNLLYYYLQKGLNKHFHFETKYEINIGRIR